jgi:hypothetical protein
MAKVHLIARFVAHEGREARCELYELYESDSRDASICTKHGKVKLR